MCQGPVTAGIRQGEVTQVQTLRAPNAQDRVALAEIELCGELMIAASAAGEERLSPDRIDEVLDVRGAESWATVPRQAARRG
ncbi:hypothetical protein M2436_003339 [Streptomyces sp. HB372]|nr:hypothetical protein [Streptomyces sp. HB372]GGY58191.1 hypothetical protein GCM10010342_52570 [Streptomyces anulatus]